MFWLIFRYWRWRRHVPPKRRLTFNGLHSVISQKVELFITTAVRTSDPLFQCIIYKPNQLFEATIWDIDNAIISTTNKQMSIMSNTRYPDRLERILHLRTETDPVSETSCFLEYRTMEKVQKNSVNSVQYTQLFNRSRDSAVGTATGYGLDGRGVGVRVPVGSRIFSSPRRTERLWGSPSLLPNGYQGLFLRG
jgi:hypothetical protein